LRDKKGREATIRLCGFGEKDLKWEKKKKVTLHFYGGMGGKNGGNTFTSGKMS